MNNLALCSGYQGIELGLESRIDGFRTVCHVEGEAYAASVLIKKIQEGTIHEAAVWSNLKTFNGEPWRSKVDIITGGFPCQPHSKAGKLLAQDDPRNLWPDVKRIIREVRPRILFLENVSNINNTIAPSIVGELAEMGFNAAWCVVRASDVGAPHKRARWFIMATKLRNPNSNGHCEHADEKSGKRIIKKRELEGNRFENISNSNTDPNHSNESNMRINESFKGSSELKRITLSNSNSKSSDEKLQRTNRKIPSKSKRLPRRKDKRKTGSKPWGKGSNDERQQQFEEWWAVEPPVGRMVDGVAYWVDRLRGCGNGVVPQQAAYAFDILSTALFNQSFDD